MKKVEQEECDDEKKMKKQEGGCKEEQVPSGFMKRDFHDKHFLYK